MNHNMEAIVNQATTKPRAEAEQLAEKFHYLSGLGLKFNISGPNKNKKVPRSQLQIYITSTNLLNRRERLQESILQRAQLTELNHRTGYQSDYGSVSQSSLILELPNVVGRKRLTKLHDENCLSRGRDEEIGVRINFRFSTDLGEDCKCLLASARYNSKNQKLSSSNDLRQLILQPELDVTIDGLKNKIELLLSQRYAHHQDTDLILLRLVGHCNEPGDSNEDPSRQFWFKLDRSQLAKQLNLSKLVQSRLLQTTLSGVVDRCTSQIRDAHDDRHPIEQVMRKNNRLGINDALSLCLYKLEQLVSESNSTLGKVLEIEALYSCLTNLDFLITINGDNKLPVSMMSSDFSSDGESRKELSDNNSDKLKQFNSIKRARRHKRYRHLKRLYYERLRVKQDLEFTGRLPDLNFENECAGKLISYQQAINDSDPTSDSTCWSLAQISSGFETSTNDSGLDSGNSRSFSGEEELLMPRLVLAPINKSTRKLARLQANSIVQLNDCIRFKAQTQEIINYSVNFFTDCINKSKLFTLWQDQNESCTDKCDNSMQEFELPQLPLACQRLRVQVCCECQRLRSLLRFVWLPNCLQMAFGAADTESTSGQNLSWNKTRAELVLSDWPDQSLAKPTIKSLPGFQKLPLAKQYTLANKKETENLSKSPIRHNDKRLPTKNQQQLEMFALLLGQLLRRHFLIEALDRWAKILQNLSSGSLISSQIAIDQATISSTSFTRPSLLRMAVELDEISSMVEQTTSQLELDRPVTSYNKLIVKPVDELMRQSLADFVVDELAGVCNRLPRFEQLLELSWRRPLNRFRRKRSSRTALEPDSIRYICTITMGDKLLDLQKLQMREIIDGALNGKPIHPDIVNYCNTFAYIQTEYLIALQLANTFRSGVEMNLDGCRDWRIKIWDAIKKLGKMETVLLSEQPIIRMDSQTDLPDDLRLHWNQISLLDLAHKLIELHLPRYQKFGQLATIDLSPMRDSLSKCIKKERLILIRVKLDEQVRLMEQLRLQFDEIELNLDLEAAIEEYLQERWQAKQRQEPEAAEQLLEDNGDVLPSMGQFEVDPNTGELLIDGNADDDDDGEGGRVEDDSEPEADQDDESSVKDEEGTSSSKLSEDDGESELGLAKSDEDFVNNLMSGSGNQPSGGQQAALLALSMSGGGGAKTNATTTTNETSASGEAKQSSSKRPSTNPNVIADANTKQSINPVQDWTNAGERRLVSVIESQLLLGRYEYLHRLFVGGELNALIKDLEVSLAGLSFMAEHVTASIQLEPNQWELVAELAFRSSQFNELIRESWQRLEQSRSRLLQLHQFRSQVTNRLVLEYHMIMQTIATRRLASNAAQTQKAVDEQALGQQKPQDKSKELTGKSDHDGDHDEEPATDQQQIIKTADRGSRIASNDDKFENRTDLELDYIQENADWSAKLAKRLEFLIGQNRLLAKESKISARIANLSQQTSSFMARKQHLNKFQLPRILEPTGEQDRRPEVINSNDDVIENRTNVDETEIGEQKLVAERLELLERWRQLSKLISDFWLLAQNFETIQVKWFNSDSKRIDFQQIETKFVEFCQQLRELKVRTEDYRANLTGNDNRIEDETHSSRVSSTIILVSNLNELEHRLNLFDSKRLPLFNFLMNERFNEQHIVKIAAILRPNSPLDETVRQLMQCTTVSQMLELNYDEHIDEIEQLARQARLESELNQLIRLENYATSAWLSRNLPSSDLALGDEVRLASSEDLLMDFETLNIDSWNDNDLKLAANHIIRVRLKGLLECSVDSRTNQAAEDKASEQESLDNLIAKLLGIHDLMRRFWRLSSTLDLIGVNSKPHPVVEVVGPRVEIKASKKSACLVSTIAHRQLRPDLFLELVRLYAISWFEAQSRLTRSISRLENDLFRVGEHLRDIDDLEETIRRFEGHELRHSSKLDHDYLADIERRSVKLELEREILATRESQALREQREALKIRDQCIRQIHERAIPAIRASSRALDRLDARWLRAVRSFRPKPPKTIRLVIEATCLLRSTVMVKQTNNEFDDQDQINRKSNYGLDRDFKKHDQFGQHPVELETPILMEPERRFDSLTGRMVEDYWPAAYKMLNGAHSIRFLNDLRRVNQKNLPIELMRLIRRLYLSSRQFNLAHIERVSADAAHLARWLIGVDVFDRVMQVVKPNYKLYLESERRLAALLDQVEARRVQLESMGHDLHQMDKAYERRIGKKMALAEALDQCRRQAAQVKSSASELIAKRKQLSQQLAKFRHCEKRLPDKCLLDAASIVYIESTRSTSESCVRTQALSLLQSYLKQFASRN